MKKRQFINTLSVGDTVECHFIITKAERKLSKVNTPYWDITLQDSSGAIPAKIWHPVSADIIELNKEDIVYIKGSIESYNTTLQCRVESLSILTDTNSIDLSDFVRSSQYPIEHMWNQLMELCSDVFTHKPWYNFTISFFSDPDNIKVLQTASAAKSMHHAYRGGLLEHMLSVAHLCRLLASHYPHVDEQVLVAGALFHDIGKIVELHGFLVTEYTTQGKLLGHITQGINLITPYMQKAHLEESLQVHLQHLILSHHGFLEFGSPKLPQTAEAFLLHYADNIDAKMEVFRTAFESTKPDEEAWTKVFGVGDIFHPIPTVSFEKKEEVTPTQEKKSEQFSLLRS